MFTNHINVTTRQPRWRPPVVAYTLVLGALAGLSTTMAQAVTAEFDLLQRPAQVSTRASKSVLMAVTRADRRLVAVGELGIILLSDDNGTTWRQAAAPVSVALTNVRFASAKLGWAVGHSGVVLHSSDGGETWVKQFDGKQAAQIELEAARAEARQDDPVAQKRLKEAEALVGDGADKPLLDVCFTDANNGIVVGAYGLIFATRDGGKTWRSLKGRIDNPKGKHLYSLYAEAVGLYVAGEQGVLYRSTDAGQHFTAVKTPYAGTYFGALVAPTGELIAYGLRGNAYRSADGGGTWQKIDLGLPVTLTAGTRLSDGSLVLTDETGRVLQSRDAGATFKTLPVPQPSPFTGVAQAADGSLIFSSARGMTRLPLKTNLAEHKQ